MLWLVPYPAGENCPPPMTLRDTASLFGLCADRSASLSLRTSPVLLRSRAKGCCQGSRTLQTLCIDFGPGISRADQPCLYRASTRAKRFWALVYIQVCLANKLSATDRCRLFIYSFVPERLYHDSQGSNVRKSQELLKHDQSLSLLQNSDTPNFQL